MLLPTASLVMALFLVVLPVASVFMKLEHFSNGSDRADFSAGNFQARIWRTEFLSTALLLFASFPFAWVQQARGKA
jgi:hypothetical protein